jgi:hypothetical protein
MLRGNLKRFDTTGKDVRKVLRDLPGMANFGGLQAHGTAEPALSLSAARHSNYRDGGARERRQAAFAACAAPLAVAALA